MERTNLIILRASDLLASAIDDFDEDKRRQKVMIRTEIL